MKLEIGKYYRTRDGKKVGPMQKGRGITGYDWDAFGSSQFYSNKGKADDGIQYDITAEWTDTTDDTVTDVSAVEQFFADLRTAADTPTLWRDMTPEEKGALLLAEHEGEQVQFSFSGTGNWENIYEPMWSKTHAYRIKPKPKVETVTLYWCYGNSAYMEKKWPDTHSITLTIRDGKVDQVAQVEEL